MKYWRNWWHIFCLFLGKCGITFEVIGSWQLASVSFHGPTSWGQHSQFYVPGKVIFITVFSWQSFKTYFLRALTGSPGNFLCIFSKSAWDPKIRYLKHPKTQNFSSWVFRFSSFWMASVSWGLDAMQIQWGSEIRPYEIRIHLKSGLFEGRILNGPVSKWLGCSL